MTPVAKKHRRRRLRAPIREILAMMSGRRARGVSPKPSSGTDSPCVSVCVMDDGTGLCLGCWRTLGEIAAWASLGSSERELIWQKIEQRRDGLL